MAIDIAFDSRLHFIVPNDSKKFEDSWKVEQLEPYFEELIKTRSANSGRGSGEGIKRCREATNRAMCVNGYDAWRCDRTAGHDGDHISINRAALSSEVLAIWSQEEAAALKKLPESTLAAYQLLAAAGEVEPLRVVHTPRGESLFEYGVDANYLDLPVPTWESLTPAVISTKCLVGSPNMGWQCTRDKDHGGIYHRATDYNINRVVARWKKETKSADL